MIELITTANRKFHCSIEWWYFYWPCSVWP